MSKPKIISLEDKIAFWRGLKRSDDGDYQPEIIVNRSVEKNSNQVQQPTPGPQPLPISGGAIAPANPSNQV